MLELLFGVKRNTGGNDLPWLSSALPVTELDGLYWNNNAQQLPWLAEALPITSLDGLHAPNELSQDSPAPASNSHIWD